MTSIDLPDNSAAKSGGRYAIAELPRTFPTLTGSPVGPQRGRSNRLLRALSAEDYAWVSPQLESVRLDVPDLLIRPDEPADYVYFMESGVGSIVSRLETGATVEVGTVGPEGMAGIQALVDGGSLPSETFMQVAGHGCRLSAAAIREAAAQRPAFRGVLDRFTQAFLIQVSQTAACNRVHTVDERCARWLLMTHDRVGESASFELTHNFLAYMLGARRASVTVAAGQLQRAGIIRYSRGKVSVIDRARLEQSSCECYRIVRRHFDRLLGGESPVT